MEVSLRINLDTRNRVERLEDTIRARCARLPTFFDRVQLALRLIGRDDWVVFSAGKNKFVQFYKDQHYIFLDVPIINRGVFYYYDVVNVLHQHKVYPLRPLWGQTLQWKYYRLEVEGTPENPSRRIEARLGTRRDLAAKIAEGLMRQIHIVEDVDEVEIEVGTSRKGWLHEVATFIKGRD